MDISEKNFEATIEGHLLGKEGGYRKRRPEDYHRALCLDPDAVLDFIYATQPKEWEKLKQQHGADVKPRFLHRLASEVAKRGTLDVLRKGIKDSGCKFQLAYFRPATGLNEAVQRLYEANQFSVVRQLRFSERNEASIDMVLFLNGLPIFTAELKNPLKGQDVQDAIRQYRERDRREPFFAFGRCLAHFAVDPDLVYLTTHLRRRLPLSALQHGAQRRGGEPAVMERFCHGLPLGTDMEPGQRAGPGAELRPGRRGGGRQGQKDRHEAAPVPSLPPTRCGPPPGGGCP